MKKFSLSNILKVFLIIFPFILSSPAFSENLTREQWESDVEIVSSEILDVLDEIYEERPRTEHWREYKNDYISKLRKKRNTLHTKSYDKMTDIAAELERVFEQNPATERWQDCREFIETRFHSYARDLS